MEIFSGNTSFIVGNIYFIILVLAKPFLNSHCFHKWDYYSGINGNIMAKGNNGNIVANNGNIVGVSSSSWGYSQ